MKYPKNWPGIIDSDGMVCELLETEPVTLDWLPCRPCHWAWPNSCAAFVTIEGTRALTPAAESMIAIARGAKAKKS